MFFNRAILRKEKRQMIRPVSECKMMEMTPASKSGRKTVGIEKNQLSECSARDENQNCTIESLFRRENNDLDI